MKTTANQAGGDTGGEAGGNSRILQKALAFRTKHSAPGATAPEVGMHCLLSASDVSQLLKEAGESDPFLLLAATLHDMLQVASVTEVDIAAVFGSEAAYLVAEITDNPRLSNVTRKSLRLSIAPHMSRRGKLLKLAQLVASVRNLAGDSVPVGWDARQRLDFFDWVERFAVAAAVGSINPTLQAIMLAELERGRMAVGTAMPKSR